MSLGSAGLTVVFAAVRGTSTIRTTSGALIVTGTIQITGTTTTVFVFPQRSPKPEFGGVIH